MEWKKGCIRSVQTTRVDTAKTYIKNLSNVQLTDSEMLVLSKNLKFIPTPSPPRTREIMKDFDDLARRMRTRLWVYENNIKRKSDPLLTKKKKMTNIPSDNVSLENYLTATKIELANLHNSWNLSRQEKVKRAIHNIKTNKRFKKRHENNFSPNLRNALNSLKKNKNIIIKKSDKGNCTVVVSREQYVKEGMRQLNSCAHYTPVNEDLSPSFCKRVHDTLKEIHAKGEINDEYLEYLSPVGKETTRTAELYLLNKIHSDPPTKARPIISANECPVEKISEYVDFFLQPFVIEQNTYIKDTSDFIRKLEQIKVPENAYIITLDYESMYTNIVHDEAISAVENTISQSDRHKYVQGIKRPSTESFCKLIELAVKCNNFKFDSKNYYQCRGVAMGHKASPAICDIVIYFLEKRILALAENKVYTWLRFRDDVFALYIGTEEEARCFLDKANKIHATLKFKYDISLTQGTFLDTIVFKGNRFRNENILDFKPYTKPSEKFQYIHRESAHPKQVFSGLIKAELTRFVRTATNKEDYLTRANLFKEKLLVRGYTAHEFEQAFSQVKHELRSTYLQEKVKENKKHIPLVFTTIFSPHLRGQYKALTRSWGYIENSEHLRKVFPQRPLLAYRRNKNLRDHLVRARLQPIQEIDCNNENCDLDQLVALVEKDPDAGI